MADITQFIKRDESELFSPNNQAALAWFRENYDGQESVIFRLPTEQLGALEFRRAAEEKGFTVEAMRQ